ncbi:hypothetical protein KAX21_03330, partial [candidate division WOR-3 bacterium]|nr:hypothetical protein [candidate division WOR-3 bacterium]
MSSLPRWVMRELGWRFVIHEFIFREAAEYVADSTRCSGLLLEFLEYLHRENRCCYLDKSVDGESVLERRYFAILDSLSNKQKFIKEIFNKLVRKG